MDVAVQEASPTLRLVSRPKSIVEACSGVCRVKEMSFVAVIGAARRTSTVQSLISLTRSEYRFGRGRPSALQTTAAAKRYGVNNSQASEAERLLLVGSHPPGVRYRRHGVRRRQSRSAAAEPHTRGDFLGKDLNSALLWYECGRIFS